jgi:hypothetical protein
MKFRGPKARLDHRAIHRAFSPDGKAEFRKPRGLRFAAKGLLYFVAREYGCLLKDPTTHLFCLESVRSDSTALAPWRDEATRPWFGWLGSPKSGGAGKGKRAGTLPELYFHALWCAEGA